MRQHRLGRKRSIDMLLACTFREAGVMSILTTNARGFTILGGFTCVTP
jgi:hypothetical protein